MTDAHSTYGDKCPECGVFDQLITTAPTVPALLLETGIDADIEAWEDEHDYNIVKCLACGWQDEGG